MASYKGYSTIGNCFGSTRLVDSELVKRDLLNHFLTRRGEKLMNPEFGSGLQDLLMEPLTDQLKNLILEEVNTVFDNDPRVRVEQLVVDEFEHGVQIEAKLLYVLTDQTENLLLRFNRQDGTFLV